MQRLEKCTISRATNGWPKLRATVQSNAYYMSEVGSHLISLLRLTHSVFGFYGGVFIVQSKIMKLIFNNFILISHRHWAIDGIMLKDVGCTVCSVHQEICSRKFNEIYQLFQNGFCRSLK